MKALKNGGLHDNGGVNGHVIDVAWHVYQKILGETLFLFTVGHFTIHLDFFFF